MFELQHLRASLCYCRYVSELLGGEKFVSCSVVLPALCHLSRVMDVTEDDPAYMIKFKGTFTADIDERKEKINITWLRVATALDPRLDCHAIVSLILVHTIVFLSSPCFCWVASFYLFSYFLILNLAS